MVVSYSYVLAAGQKSNTPGFGATAEWDPVENMAIVDRVGNKQMQAAELILDLFENKVVKSRNVDSDEEKNKLFNMFVTKYFDDVKVALVKWIAADSKNLAKVQTFVDNHNAKKEEADDSAAD